MASPSGVVFPASMADFLANPIDFYFSSMPAESIALAACLVIENTAATSTQQVESDLLAETHQLTPRDLIVGLDHVEGMLSDTIKVCKSVKRPRRTTPPPPRMHEEDPDRILVEHLASWSRRGPLDNPYLVHENSKHTARQCRVLKKLRRPPTMTYGRQINPASSPDRGMF
jgi:hypothetical protein